MEAEEEPSLVNLWGGGRAVRAAGRPKSPPINWEAFAGFSGLAWPGLQRRLAFLSINKSLVQHQSRSPLSIEASSSRLFL